MDTSIYTVAKEIDGVKAWIAITPDKYHTSRYLQLQQQWIYASAGNTKDVLEQYITTILDMVNSDKPVSSFRTDIGVICNNIKYRMKFPVDEMAALRMGMTVAFLDGENPEQPMTHHWQSQKEKLCENGEWYTFFLSMGIEHYNELVKSLSISNIEDYFSQRRQTLGGLEPWSKK